MSKHILVLVLLFSAQAALAQDTTQTLDEVVVTTNKYPKKQSETGKVVTVINEATLQQMQAKTIGEILNTVAGVTINGANNNPGTNLGVSIRGSSFGNVLILMDGIPVNDPSLISNYYDLNFINTAQVARIEILKGGQSTLYGSDAVAGVINIITRKKDSIPVSVNALVKAGSYGTFEGSAGVHGGLKKGHYSLQHTYLRSDGFSTAYDSSGSDTYEKDGFQQNSLRGAVGYRIASNVSARLFGSYSRYKAAIDAGPFTDDADYTTNNQNAQGGLGITATGAKGILQFNYQFNYVQRAYLDDSADRGSPFAYFSNSRYIGRTHFAELYQTFRLNRTELLVGADYRYHNTAQAYYSMGSFGPYEAPPFSGNMAQVSPYASVVYNPSGFNMELGGRWNHHSTYGNNFTYTVNPSYLIGEKLKVFGNASSAFKAPTLYQLFDASAGNKDLQPETSATLESGLELYATPALRLRTTYFHRNIKNAIQYVLIDPTNFIAQYRNISRQQASGIEAELHLQNTRWNVASNYTYTHGSATAAFTESGAALGKDTTYNNLYRVPRHAFNTFASYAVTPQLNLGTLLRIVGERLEPVYGASPKTLAPYYTLDLSAHYTFHTHWRVFADFKNITAQRYFDVLGYTNRRFNFMTGLSVTF